MIYGAPLCACIEGRIIKSCISDGKSERGLQKNLWSHPTPYRSLGRVDVTACVIASTTL